MQAFRIVKQIERKQEITSCFSEEGGRRGKWEVDGKSFQCSSLMLGCFGLLVKKGEKKMDERKRKGKIGPMLSRCCGDFSCFGQRSD